MLFFFIKQTGKTDSYILGRLPFSVHYSLVTCASLVSLNTTAVALGCSPSCKHTSTASVRLSSHLFIHVFAAQYMLAAGTEVAAVLIGGATSIVNKDPVPAFVTAWALLAMYATALLCATGCQVRVPKCLPVSCHACPCPCARA